MDRQLAEKSGLTSQMKLVISSLMNNAGWNNSQLDDYLCAQGISNLDSMNQLDAILLVEYLDNYIASEVGWER